jgi:hypothetical protein
VYSKLLKWCKLLRRQWVFVFWREVSRIRHTCLNYRHQSHYAEPCEGHLNDDPGERKIWVFAG